MTGSNHIHEFEIEHPDEDQPPLLCKVAFTFEAGHPGQLSGPPENCFPPEPDEIEITHVWIRALGSDVPIRYDANPDLFGTVAEYAMENEFDRMREEADACRGRSRR
jgi:hypothetical protein